jgi:hypothetical protein
MRGRERQRLETQLQRLKDKQHQLTTDITHMTRKLRDEARHERQKRLLLYGELVEHAGLAHIDPGTLLGGLYDLEQRMRDPNAGTHYKAVGELLLAAYLQRKWHRKQRPTASPGTPRPSTSSTPEAL